MAKDYNTVATVQQFDGMACWAASMEWWLSYMSPARPFMNQYDIIAIPALMDETFYPANDNAANFGGLSKDGMKAMFNHAPFQMQYKKYAAGSLKMSSLKKRLKKSPIIIIYNDSVAGGYHANVVVQTNESGGVTLSLTSMDPATATFEARFLSWFNSDELYIGWAK